MDLAPFSTTLLLFLVLTSLATRIKSRRASTAYARLVSRLSSLVASAPGIVELTDSLQAYVALIKPPSLRSVIKFTSFDDCRRRSRSSRGTWPALESHKNANWAIRIFSVSEHGPGRWRCIQSHRVTMCACVTANLPCKPRYRRLVTGASSNLRDLRAALLPPFVFPPSPRQDPVAAFRGLIHDITLDREVCMEDVDGCDGVGCLLRVLAARHGDGDGVDAEPSTASERSLDNKNNNNNNNNCKELQHVQLQEQQAVLMALDVLKRLTRRFGLDLVDRVLERDGPAVVGSLLALGVEQAARDRDVDDTGYQEIVSRALLLLCRWAALSPTRLAVGAFDAFWSVLTDEHACTYTSRHVAYAFCGVCVLSVGDVDPLMRLCLASADNMRAVCRGLEAYIRRFPYDRMPRMVMEAMVARDDVGVTRRATEVPGGIGLLRMCGRAAGAAILRDGVHVDRVDGELAEFVVTSVGAEAVFGGGGGGDGDERAGGTRKQLVCALLQDAMFGGVDGDGDGDGDDEQGDAMGRTSPCPSPSSPPLSPPLHKESSMESIVLDTLWEGRGMEGKNRQTGASSVERVRETAFTTTTTTSVVAAGGDDCPSSPFAAAHAQRGSTNGASMHTPARPDRRACPPSESKKKRGLQMIIDACSDRTARVSHTGGKRARTEERTSGASGASSLPTLTVRIGSTSATLPRHVVDRVGVFSLFSRSETMEDTVDDTMDETLDLPASLPTVPDEGRFARACTAVLDQLAGRAGLFGDEDHLLDCWIVADYLNVQSDALHAALYRASSPAGIAWILDRFPHLAPVVARCAWRAMVDDDGCDGTSVRRLTASERWGRASAEGRRMIVEGVYQEICTALISW